MNSISILYNRVLFLLIIAIIVVIQFTNSANCQSSDGSFPGQDDLLQSLPNVSLPPSTDYSSVGHYVGYLNISIGYRNISSMYYWFFRAQTDNWQTQPVVLHLGGYVSTLHGALIRISPLRIQQNATISLNEYAWNKRANLLFLDSNNQVSFPELSARRFQLRNDAVAVNFTYQIIEKFYQKFHFLSENEFFISGEGYNSIHVGVLAKHLVEKRFPLNFKGVLLGNGVFNTSEAVNAHFEYVYRLKRDLYDQTFWDNLKKIAHINPAHIGQTLIDILNFGQDPCTFRKCQTFDSVKIEDPKLQSDCYKFYRAFYKDLLFICYQHGPKSFDLHNIHEECVPGLENATCSRYIITQKINDWLNSVRNDLHVNETASWFRAGNIVNFCKFKRQYPTLHGHLMFLLRNNIRVLLYTGDSDGFISPYNTEWLLNDLSLQPMHQKQAWEFDGKPAGFRVRYCGDLSHYGIKGAGHTVAEDKPGPLFGMVNEFIFGDHSANALSPWDGHCSQNVLDCDKFCSTDPLPAVVDEFCDFWIESMHRYFIMYDINH